MKKNSTPLEDVISKMKKNPTLVIFLAVILVIAAFIYIPTIQQELGAKPSEAFDAEVYPGGGLGTGIPISWNDLSITLDPTTPPDSIFLGGTNDNIAAKFRWKATGEDFIVKQLTLYFPHLKLNQCEQQTDGIGSVKITYIDSTGEIVTKKMPAPLPPELTIPPIPMAKLVFSDLDIYVPIGEVSDNLVLLVSFDTKPMYPGIFGGIGGSSDMMSVGIGNGVSGVYEAIGQTRGKIDTSFTDHFLMSSTHVLYATKPTVTNDNLELTQQTLNPGETNDLYRFKIKADYAGTLQIERLTFNVSINDNFPQNNDTNLGGFSIWRDDIEVYDIEVNKTIISNQSGQSVKIKGVNDFGPNSSGNINVQFIDIEIPYPPDDEQSYVLADHTVTWTLKGDLGSGFSVEDSIEIQLMGLPYMPANPYGMGNKIADFDNEKDEYRLQLGVFEACGEYGVHYYSNNEQSYFIWSDLSANHKDHIFDLSPESNIPMFISSPDFTGAHLIDNFPMPKIELSV